MPHRGSDKNHLQHYLLSTSSYYLVGARGQVYTSASHPQFRLGFPIKPPGVVQEGNAPKMRGSPSIP